MMLLREEQRDLFTLPHSYYFAHCISGDFALGAGIAVKFNEIYNMRDKLKRAYCSVDNNCCLKINNVFNLVTKKKYWHKPTYESLTEALEQMKTYVEVLGVKKLAMPQIGCGLDKLEWSKVKEIIIDVFKDSDIEILVCYL